MTMLLFAISEFVFESMKSVGADKLLTLTGAVAYAVYITRRMNAITSAFNKYMAEDRTKMIQIIETNNRLLERLEKKI